MSLKALWHNAREFVIHRILHADDTPHRIALGVAIGTFIGITPTVGLQMFLAFVIAHLFKANKAACVPMVWITNPVTIAPIYGACLLLGSWIVPGDPGLREKALHELYGLAGANVSFFERIISAEFWEAIFHLMVQIGLEMWLGCLIVGVPTSIIAYFVVRRLTVVYRERRRQRMIRLDEAREKRRLRTEARKAKAAKANPVARATGEPL